MVLHGIRKGTIPIHIIDIGSEMATGFLSPDNTEDDVLYITSVSFKLPPHNPPTHSNPPRPPAGVPGGLALILGRLRKTES